MKTYFAAFIPSDGQWAVLFADFELSTQGDTLGEAFAAAQEALHGRVKCMMEDGEALPEPSDMVQARSRIAHWCAEEDLPLPEGTLFQMVPCEEVSTRLVRVNVSFPESVLERIDAKAKLAGMTRSGFLAVAAQRYQA
ncbi:type II toxin-antitoxin system HicB family antitoxin [uncultured Desulfovibrio sp.]|uniref:type II toxin-antitoxin system HicB family antitoxin n=1 Tax=uncultured Desulfovibrio sp. TaxID=167968 RepID=UPI002627FAFE|nr:type II toxin-antitoxin system HicB family antitoxin [uncultured Desulfovibrio sp.]